MKSIVTLTMNPALDMFLEVPWMKPDRKLRCSDPTYAPGLADTLRRIIPSEPVAREERGAFEVLL